jgi:heterodisulfide reductase subunit C2
MTVPTASALTAPQPQSRKRIEDLSHQPIATCYQCQKCTNGCPASFAMDIAPHRVMRLLQLGLLDRALKSDTIWACASCQTCSTRCPNEIDIAGVMESLRRLSLAEGKAAYKNTGIFDKEFLSSVESHGRLWELGLILRYTLKSQGLGGLIKQTPLGLEMLSKGKLSILPRSAKAGETKAVFKAARKKSQK